MGTLLSLPPPAPHPTPAAPGMDTLPSLPPPAPHPTSAAAQSSSEPPFAPHLPWFPNSHHGNSKPKQSRTYWATGRMCSGILYPRVCVVPGIPLQAGASCLLQLPPGSPTARQEGMLEQAQVLQGGDADSSQCCSLCTGFASTSCHSHRSFCVLYPQPQRSCPWRFVEPDFRCVLRFAQSCFQGSSGWKYWLHWDKQSLSWFWRELLLGLERASVAVLVTPRLVAVTLGDTLLGPSTYQEDKQNIQLPTVPGVRASSFLWGASLPGNILHSLVLIAGSSPAWLR